MAENIRVEIELDTGDFEAGVVRANTTLAKLQSQASGTIVGIKRMSDSGREFSEVLRDWTVIAATAGAALENINRVSTGVIGKIVHMNAEVERLTVLLTSLSTAANPVKEATEQLSNLREQAKQAPFSLEAMHQAFIRLKTGGIDPTKGAMQALVDAVAATGGSDDQLKRASLALQEMGAKGVVQMKELRVQLAQALPGSLQIMARAFGVTYEKLTSDIHTGTVDAQKAIGALGLELERTFGGGAQRQMETFFGQVARSKVALLDLALAIGGQNADGSIAKDGFFAKVKDQLTELNDELDSGQAKKFAQEIGTGLSMAAGYVSKGAHLLVDYKSAIISIGEAWVAGKLLSGVGTFFGTVKNYIEGAKTNFAELYTKMELAGAKLEQIRSNTGTSMQGRYANLASAFSNANMAFGGLGPNQSYLARSNAQMSTAAKMMSLMQVASAGAGAGMTALAGGVRMAGVAIGALATGFMAVAPWLGLVFAGVSLLNETFGIFKNRAKDAADEMLNFGASSEAQIKLATERLAVLEKFRAQQDDLRKNPGSDTAGIGRLSDDDLKSMDREIATLREKLAGAGLELANKDAQPIIRAQMKELEEGQAKIQRQRMQAINEEEKAYAEATKRLLDSKQTTYNLDREHQAKLREINNQEYDEEIAALSKVYDAAKSQQAELNALQAKGKFIDPAKMAASLAVLDKAGKQLEEIRRQRDEYSKQDLGVPTGAKPFNLEKLMKDSQADLDKFDAKIEGSKAGLEGLDPLVAQLNEGMRLKAIGQEDIPDVQKMIEALGKAKEQADELNAALEGKQKLDRDEAALREKLEDEIFKLQYGHLSETDQLRIKIQSGHYAGFGLAKDAMSQRIIDMRQNLENVTAQGVTTGEALKGAFDPDHLNAFATGLGKIEASMSSIGDAAKAFSSVTGGATLAGVNGTAMMTGGASLGKLNANFFSTGGAGLGSTFLSRLVGAEDGSGDPNARNSKSSAMGLTQFTTGTWDQFLMAMHPDQMRNPNRSALRADPQMSEEAALWYAGVNAKSLSGAGIDPTDANLYAAHFLGPGNAIKVLGSDPSASIASLPGLSSAIAANQSVLGGGQTVAGFQAWLQGRMGSGSTFMNGGAIVPQGGLPATGNAVPTGSSFFSTFGAPTVNSSYPNGPHLGATANTPAYMQRNLNTDANLENQKTQLVIADKIKKLLEDLDKQTARFGERQDGKQISKLDAMIKAGDLDPTNKDVNSPAYAKVRAAAQGTDKAQEDYETKEKSAKEADAAGDELKKGRIEALAKYKAALAQLANPGGMKMPSEVTDAQTKNAERLAKLEDEHGKNSKEYLEAQKDSQAQVNALTNAAVTNEIDGYAKKTAAMKDGLMTRDQAEADEYARAKKRIEDDLAIFKGSEDEKKALANQGNTYLQTLAATQLQNSPIGQTLKSYTDISANVQQNLMQIQGSAIDNLAKMISGQKLKWRDLMHSITMDFTKTALQFGVGSIEKSIFGGVGSLFGLNTSGSGGSSLFSGLFGGASNAATGAATGGLFSGLFGSSAAAGAGSVGLGGLSSLGSGFTGFLGSIGNFFSGLFGVHHTGGIVGSPSMTRQGSMLDFIGAPRFHTGGIIGSDEVPIIAQKGEGVFTQAQMAAIGQGGGHNFQINAPIQVNGNGGDPKANQDLAERMQKQFTDTMRKQVTGMIAQQLRPGNMLQNVAK